MNWTSDGPPPDKVVFRTVQAGRARNYGGRKMIDRELSDTHYAIEFVSKELLDRFGLELKMQATALYGYARFEGDDRAKLSFDVPKASYKRIPASGWDYFKAWLQGYLGFVNSIFKSWHAEHVRRVGWYNNPVNLRLPQCWQPKYKILEVVTREAWSKHIERIQEGLVAQIDLLYKYGLEPQAVLASPDIAHNLVAVSMPSDYYSRMNIAIDERGCGQFMGLPVITVKELRWGAIVV